MLQIKKFTVSELELREDYQELLAEYGRECANLGLPPVTDKIEAYKTIEKSGMFSLFCAFYNDILIGIVTVLTPVMPHYQAVIAVAESLFVAKKYRPTGAGLRLIRHAKKHALSFGCKGLLFSAPKDGKLEKLLPRLGYRETNTTFYLGFEDAR